MAITFDLDSIEQEPTQRPNLIQYSHTACARNHMVWRCVRYQREREQFSGIWFSHVDLPCYLHLCDMA